MRKLLTLSVFFLLGCGRDDVTGTRVGEIRNFEPVVVESSERERIRAICNALVSKTTGLSQAPNPVLTFNVAQKDCGTENLNQEQLLPVSVTIDSTTAPFRLKRSDNGLPFVFPELETASTGMMGTICPGIEELTNPLRLESGNILFFTTSRIGGDDCSAGVNERCILFETAVPNNNGAFVVKTKEWMKFQLNPLEKRYGFFTQRRIISSALCPLNQFSEARATLQ